MPFMLHLKLFSTFPLCPCWLWVYGPITSVPVAVKWEKGLGPSHPHLTFTRFASDAHIPPFTALSNLPLTVKITARLVYKFD